MKTQHKWLWCRLEKKKIPLLEVCISWRHEQCMCVCAKGCQGVCLCVRRCLSLSPRPLCKHRLQRAPSCHSSHHTAAKKKKKRWKRRDRGWNNSAGYDSRQSTLSLHYLFWFRRVLTSFYRGVGRLTEEINNLLLAGMFDGISTAFSDTLTVFTYMSKIIILKKKDSYNKLSYTHTKLLLGALQRPRAPPRTSSTGRNGSLLHRKKPWAGPDLWLYLPADRRMGKGREGNKADLTEKNWLLALVVQKLVLKQLAPVLSLNPRPPHLRIPW